MKHLKLIFITILVLLIQKNLFGQTIPLSGSLGPIQLGMSLDKVIEVAGIKKIQRCPQSETEIITRFVKDERDCEWIVIYKGDKVNGMVSSSFSINGIDFMHLSGDAKVVNERTQALARNTWNKLEFLFVSKQLFMILIEDPNVNLSYLEEKYGTSKFYDNTKNMQCINDNGFNDVSWFGTKSYFWESSSEELELLVQKRYSENKKCIVENWNFRRTYILRDKKSTRSWEEAFDSLQKKHPIKKSDF